MNTLIVSLRGYYRCSSSKGCSARKQVERSRTDPNMLVITYTSEHNHPWPIQRNALAGSTRSSSSNPTSSKSLTANANATISSNGHKNTTHLPSSATPLAASAVKDEQPEEDIEFENVEDDDHNQIAAYKPELHHHHHQPEDFFADLEELEGDSLSMLLSRGCAGDQEIKTTASEGIADFFGWSDDNNNNNDQDLRSL